MIDNLRCRLLFLCLWSMSSALTAQPVAEQPPQQDDEPAAGQVATGYVFHDFNRNRKREPSEMGLSGILVSNGEKITRTDKNGKYEIPVGDDTIVFVIKPAGWRTPLDKNNLPKFYYIHKPEGSPLLQHYGVKPTGPLPKSIDFPLYPQQEPTKFQAVIFGDPQPRNQREIDYIAHDVVEELVGTNSAFGVTLGDIMFDDLRLFESSNRTVGLVGIPWYNVIGNHDVNRDAKTDRHSDETFERHFGPAYYSFNYGVAHFLVLDDVEWYVDGERGRYRGGLGPRQMEFIRADLAEVSPNKLIVLMMHIPLTDVGDRQELYRLIENRPFCLSFSAHTHTHEHRYITRADGWRGQKPHHHVVNVTVSGSWWAGAPDERGIPHAMMADGAPNGYTILSVNRNQYQLDFKAAGRSKDYQMNIQVPEIVSVEEVAETDVYVNVFNGSERTRVEMQLGQRGAWEVMERTVAADPGYVALFQADQQAGKLAWRPAVSPRRSTHLWKLRLADSALTGTQVLTVRATDPDGRVVRGRRIVRIAPPAKNVTAEAQAKTEN